MKKNTFKIVLAIILSGLALSANAALPTYTFTDLGAENFGGTYSVAAAINASGQVAGYSYTPGNGTTHATLWNGTTATDLNPLGGSNVATAINASGQVAGLSLPSGHATLWNGTTPTDLGTLGGSNSFATAINVSGQVAGFSDTTNQVGYDYFTGRSTSIHATLWNGTTSTDLGTLGGIDSGASAINASSQVAGWSTLTTGNTAVHATLWNGTTATDLGTLGGALSRAFGINASGQVVGVAETASNGSHATLWNGTTAIDLNPLGGLYSWSTAINTSGQVVGYAFFAGNAAEHAMLWNGTNAIDLNSFLDASTVAAGWVLTQATGINDNGWIVGNASNNLLGISSHAFLLAPVPEPETYCMLMMGLGLMGFLTRRRKNRHI